MKGSILAAGTFVVDYHKIIEHYPNERASARVKKEEVSPGGAPFNLLVNLAQLGINLNLHAAGRIGRDLDGRYILDTCTSKGISVDQMQADTGAGTGYTDVYTVRQSGRHTCFHFDGACLNFNRKDVKLHAIPDLKYLFLGSLGSLSQLEKTNPETGFSSVAQLLRDARKMKVETILEFAPLDRGANVVDYAGALEEADYVVLNDRVAETLMTTSLYSENQFDPGLAREVAKRFLDFGLKKGVIIQSGSGAVFLGADGVFHHRRGYFLPWDKRVGSAGVDHAFCAGFLAGLVEKKPIEICLKQGLAVSTICRKDLTPSGAIGTLENCMEYCEQLEPAIA